MTGAEQSAEASHVRSNSERAEKPDPGGKSRAVNENQMQCNSDPSARPDLWAQGITSINRPDLILCSTFIPQRIPKAFQKNALVTGSSVVWKTNRENVFATQAQNLHYNRCHPEGASLTRMLGCSVTHSCYEKYTFSPSFTHKQARKKSKHAVKRLANSDQEPQ